MKLSKSDLPMVKQLLLGELSVLRHGAAVGSSAVKAL
jgi:hypothetical protein